MFNLDLFHGEPTMTIHRGEVVIAEGERGDTMFVVVDGMLDIRINGAPVEKVGPGGVVGEMALIDHGVRSASVVAVEETTVVAVDEKRFMYLVQNHPYFAIRMMQLVVDRLRHADRHLSSVGS